jgi:hypothetical protein
VLGLVLPSLLLLPACSDDPVLGPPDEPRDDGGGSYSAIERLAPADTSAADSTARRLAPRSNPERF